MNMKNIITVTRKGQTTLPADLRRKLNLGKEGGILHIRFDEQKNEAVISRPVSIAELSKRIGRYIKPGTKPLMDVDEYFQKHRRIRLIKGRE